MSSCSHSPSNVIVMCWGLGAVISSQVLKLALFTVSQLRNWFVFQLIKTSQCLPSVWCYTWNRELASVNIRQRWLEWLAIDVHYSMDVEGNWLCTLVFTARVDVSACVRWCVWLGTDSNSCGNTDIRMNKTCWNDVHCTGMRTSESVVASVGWDHNHTMFCGHSHDDTFFCETTGMQMMPSFIMTQWINHLVKYLQPHVASCSPFLLSSSWADWNGWRSRSWHLCQVGLLLHGGKVLRWSAVRCVFLVVIDITSTVADGSSLVCECVCIADSVSQQRYIKTNTCLFYMMYVIQLVRGQFTLHVL